VPLASLEELDDLADETDVERSANDAVVIEKVMELIQRLKPLDRDVLLLYLEGLQAAEIGEVVGISSTNVAQKIHRARRYLKRHFQSGGKHDDDR
jgi:RNA polymerase sigma-70 factor (ECF subfamily)